MTIFVTGATGYVGRFIVRELISRRHRVRCLVRSIKRSAVLPRSGVEPVLGDILEPETLKSMHGCDAVIHLVAIIREGKRKGETFERLHVIGTQNVLKAAAAAHVRHFIYMSALGASVKSITPYYRTKALAEQLVKASGLPFTIFRPSFIFGPGDAVYSMLARTIRLSPFGLFPVFGTGHYRHQPVSVYDAAKCFANALERRPKNKSYDIGGSGVLSFRQQLFTIAEAIGKKVRLFSIPTLFSSPLVSFLGLFPFSPIDRDQYVMLTRDNICDVTEVKNDLGVDFIHFRDGLSYLNEKL
ncbi:NAD(P)H-binding protein [candidate division KSB1 bacterium]|nr:NAD(P)H-binding protein [candidate division KSB1 bacterium]